MSNIDAMKQAPGGRYVGKAKSLNVSDADKKVFGEYQKELDHSTKFIQGASAEIVAMATIGAAQMYGLPVSTTHVLSSGVAGTMVANQSGLQWATAVISYPDPAARQARTRSRSSGVSTPAGGASANLTK